MATRGSARAASTKENVFSHSDQDGAIRPDLDHSRGSRSRQDTRSGVANEKPARREKNVKVSAWHSKLPATDRHHDESTCTLGDNVEPYNRVSGTGGLPKCHECKRISG